MCAFKRVIISKSMMFRFLLITLVTSHKLSLEVIQFEGMWEDHTLGEGETELQAFYHTGCNVSGIIYTWVVASLEFKSA